MKDRTPDQLDGTIQVSISSQNMFRVPVHTWTKFTYPTMSSTNDQRVGYPTLPTISTLTAEDDVANNATNGIAQERNEVSNNISNDSTHQTTSTERQLRSSGPPQDISLESIVEDRVTSEERHNEILRIVARGSDEALSNYDVGTKAEMLQVYRMLSSLVHPDKQTSSEWKEKAIRAQQCKS